MEYKPRGFEKTGLLKQGFGNVTGPIILAPHIDKLPFRVNPTRRKLRAFVDGLK